MDCDILVENCITCRHRTHVVEGLWNNSKGRCSAPCDIKNDKVPASVARMPIYIEGNSVYFGTNNTGRAFTSCVAYARK